MAQTHSSSFERLDLLVPAVAKGDDGAYHVLSTGEKIYVALAANRMDLLEAGDYTIPEALDRLGHEWREALVQRWRYRGNPKRSSDS